MLLRNKAVAQAASFEQGEVHTAVTSVFCKALVGGEVMVFAMLEHKNTARSKQVTAQNEVGKLRKVAQRIGRIGKDEVELLPTTLQKAEDIAADEHVSVVAKFGKTAANEVGVVAVGLYTNHLFAASADQFERNAARSGKEIEGRYAVEINVSPQHIEDIFLGKIGRRPRFKRARNIEMAAFIASRDDSHALSTFYIQCHQVERQPFDLGDGRTVEFSSGIDDGDLLNEFFEARDERLPVGHRAAQKQLVFARVEGQLRPHMQNEIGRIVGVDHLVAVAEAETVVGEGKHLHLLAAEINEELPLCAGEAPPMKIAPHGLHQRHNSDITEVVGQHELNVFVDWVDRHCVLRRKDGVEELLVRVPRESMVIEGLGVVGIKFFKRDEQHGTIDEHLRVEEARAENAALDKSLAKVSRWRHATFHHVRFVVETTRGRFVGHGKCQRSVRQPQRDPVRVPGNRFFGHNRYLLMDNRVSPALMSPILMPA